jgi:hypothetical protein
MTSPRSRDATVRAGLTADLAPRDDSPQPRERRAAAVVRVDTSHALTPVTQQRVVALLRPAGVRAPAGLRREVQALLGRHRAANDITVGTYARHRVARTDSYPGPPAMDVPEGVRGDG